MDVRRISASVCWFAAAWLTVLAFVLVLTGFIVTPGEHWSTAGFVLAILAGAALVAIGVLMSIAFRNERRDGANRIKPDAP